MNRISIVLTMTLLGAVVAFSQPRLEIVEGTKFDFGTISKGNKVERKLTLKNVGTETLEVSKVDVSCGCTGTIISEKSIKPQATGTVLITFDSKNFSGRVHKSVTIHSNAEGAATMMVDFEAEVIEEISVTPAHIWFQDAKVGAVSTATLTVKNQGKTALTLTEAKTQLEGFTLKLPNTPIAPGKSAQIVAEFKPTAKRAVLSDGVFLTTNSNSQPQIYIQIYGAVKEFKFE
ncbi:MAG: DUF1573 domain-containing protein [Bacteroidota bacterium]